eukprot:GHVQ01021122.1.p1 GENE.GHVQ01021122.1~~GHVQ01021122.1.p1  ORF type:complete len:316 (-),score=38.48 GHVQ01021122.1:74-946(-)
MNKPTRRCLIVVVGCSRGYGRSLVQTAINCLKCFHFHFVLIGKDIEKMKSLGASLRCDNTTNTELCISYQTHMIDLAVDGSAVSKAFDAALADIENPNLFTHIYVLFNSGTVAPLGCMEGLSAECISECIAINFTSFCVMLSAIAKWIRYGVLYPKDTKGHRRSISVHAVNISSLLAKLPVRAMAMYCSVKAARNMATAAAANELTTLQDELRTIHVKYLNWAPGPMETAMVESIKCSDAASDIPTEYIPTQFITADKSAALLWGLLEADTYTSGEHVDVLDIEENPWAT